MAKCETWGGGVRARLRDRIQRNARPTVVVLFFFFPVSFFSQPEGIFMTSFWGTALGGLNLMTGFFHGKGSRVGCKNRMWDFFRQVPPFVFLTSFPSWVLLFLFFDTRNGGRLIFFLNKLAFSPQRDASLFSSSCSSLLYSSHRHIATLLICFPKKKNSLPGELPGRYWYESEVKSSSEVGWTSWTGKVGHVGALLLFVSE